MWISQGTSGATGDGQSISLSLYVRGLLQAFLSLHCGARQLNDEDLKDVSTFKSECFSQEADSAVTFMTQPWKASRVASAMWCWLQVSHKSA